ncbi:hypothetical protein MKW94_028087 [Papaver nudicaule]|uniref:Uncharacterized protein n=1 Tax=Papaver nudicaule TaxID=74823 RepID=A0AA41VRJ1_PAPNU|nr:hypothetical protein [Papaver nudicaule]
MWSCLGYYQMANKGARRSLPLTKFTSPQGARSSSQSSAHNCSKFRPGTGGRSTSTSLVWRPKMPATSASMVWRPKVPATWEKRYCEEEGFIPWEQILKTHSLKESVYKKIFDWDASANEEEFVKAKARFWFQINEIAFEPLNSEEYADIYNDNVDWNQEIDLDLYSALDRARYANDDVIEGDHNDGEDGKPKWLTGDYLYYKDMLVKPPTEGWGSEFDD